MIIRSCYRGSKAEQFEMEVLGETTDMGEEAYFVRLLPKYQKQFQEGNKITKLRKCLIGKDKLYEYVDKKNMNQIHQALKND